MIPRKIVYLLFACALASCVRQAPQHATPPTKSAAASGHERLSREVVPLRYRIDLEIDPEKSDFVGRTTIRVRVARPTAIVQLHGRDFAEVTVSAEGQSGAVAFGDGGGMTVVFPKPLAAGERELVFTYRGVVNAGTIGIFRGKTEGRDYVFSQFEATEARRAFPCFDEPRFKTPYSITVTAPAGLVVASNTPATATREREGRQIVSFAESKPLPTYLVAVAVGPFDVVDGGMADGVALRVLAPKGRGDQARLAISRTGPILATLREYFGRPYPYEKLDFVVMSDAQGFGAMENAGLITFLDILILKKEHEVTPDERRWLETAIAHEIAHQWFGNLVTTEWWDDIWLNEAFASWISTKVQEKTIPETCPALRQVQSALDVMGIDWRTDVRAIRQPVPDGSGVMSAFDGITYTKGEAVIRMLEEWLGEDVFRAGVRAYLDEHAWGNATSDDLLRALEKSSGKPVAKVARTFLDQSGTPFLDVAVRCDAGRSSLSLSQTRWLPVGAKAPQHEWVVPVCFRYGRGSDIRRTCTLLDAKSAVVPLDYCPEWIHPNDGETGYYRWRVDAERLRRLFDPGRLSPEEEVALPSHVDALVDSGLMDTGEWMSALDVFAKSPRREVVQSALGGTSWLADLVTKRGGAADEAATAAWIRDLFGVRAHALGFLPRKGESIDDGMLRELTLWTEVRFGRDRELAKEARQLADRWLADRASVPRSAAAIAVPMAAREADAAFHDRLVVELWRSQDPEERRIVGSALASVTDPALVRKTAELALSDHAKPDDFPMLVQGLMSDERLRRVVFDWLTENHAAIVAKVANEDVVAGLPSYFGGFCTSEDRDRVKAFFSAPERQVPALERNLLQVLEEIENCQRREARVAPAARAWLGNRQRTKPAP